MSLSLNFDHYFTKFDSAESHLFQEDVSTDHEAPTEHAYKKSLCMSSFETQDKSTEILTSESPQEEHAVLKEMTIKYKKDWKRILIEYEKAFHIKTTVSALKQKLNGDQVPKRHGDKYSKEDDDKLLNLISEIGFKWQEISDHFPGRCPLSLRNRYYNLSKYNKNCLINLKKVKENYSLDVLVKDIQLDDVPPFLAFIEEIRANERNWI